MVEGALFQVLAASMWKLLCEIASFASSLKIRFGWGLNWCSFMFALNGYSWIGVSLTFTDFQVSINLISAANWFTDRRLNVFSILWTLILSLILVPFRVLNNLLYILMAGPWSTGWSPNGIIIEFFNFNTFFENQLTRICIIVFYWKYFLLYLT